MKTKYQYQVVKNLPSTPGPGLRTSAPERSVVMSQHRTLSAAEKAMARYERNHAGYAQFEIEEISHPPF